MDKKQSPEEQEEREWSEKYTEKEYKKTIYSFSSSELAKITPWDTQVQLGKIAASVLGNILRNDCLRRVGEKNSSDTGVRYNCMTGQFFVYSPRIWCSMCQNKKATLSYDNKVYCEGCIEILRQQAKPKEEKKSEVKKK